MLRSYKRCGGKVEWSLGHTYLQEALVKMAQQFIEEYDVTRAHDIAAMRFCGNDIVTNFKPFAISANNDEAEFLNSHSKSNIIDMLRTGTYTRSFSRVSMVVYVVA